MNRGISFVLAAAITTAPDLVAAQIINVLPQIQQRAEDGLGGEISASITWRRGNTHLTDTVAALATTFRSGDHAFYAIGRARNNTTKDDQVLIAQTFEHLRYRHNLSSLLSVEVFAQHEYDKFRRLKLRALVGGGVRLDVRITEQISAACGLASMAEHETLTGASERGHASVRGSSYMQWVYQADERVALDSTTFVQPKLGLLQDVRWLNETALTVKGNERLGVRLSLRFAYDSRPAEGVRKLDSIIESAVVITL